MQLLHEQTGVSRSFPEAPDFSTDFINLPLFLGARLIDFLKMSNIIWCQTFSRTGFTELGVGLIQFLPYRLPHRIAGFKILDSGFELLDGITDSSGQRILGGLYLIVELPEPSRVS